MVNEAALERVAAALAAGRGCQLSADDVIAVAKRVWPRLQDQKVVILEDRNAEALAKKAKAAKKKAKAKPKLKKPKRTGNAQ